jgi:hypothetical protein
LKFGLDGMQKYGVQPKVQLLQICLKSMKRVLRAVPSEDSLAQNGV